MTEYEISGIENIVRGVCIVGGKVLLCRPKKGGYSYLPGGHIEFGETSRQALIREMREETGLDCAVGNMAGVVESQFEQHGHRHCEISIVYEMALAVEPSDVTAREDWIEFVWWPVDRLSEAHFLPEEMARYVHAS